jgi:hypothetical protein
MKSMCNEFGELTLNSVLPIQFSSLHERICDQAAFLLGVYPASEAKFSCPDTLRMSVLDQNHTPFPLNCPSFGACVNLIIYLDMFEAAESPAKSFRSQLELFLTFKALFDRRNGDREVLTVVEETKTQVLLVLMP